MNNKKLTLVPLILMIFTSVFGFANMPRSYYLMGYAAIPWYIISALTFFIPYAFMMAEYGAAFKDEKNGIYTWMEKSVGPRYAFVGIFMWYASYVIWMVNICSTIWIPFSNFLFGEDRTQSWSFLGLNSTQFIGVLGVLWILLVTLISTAGLEGITKFTSVGGTAVAILNVVLMVGAIIVLIGNGGELLQPIEGAKSFVVSPNSDYVGFLPTLSFLVFAIFAYGGLEAVGGLVEDTHESHITFPKAVTISAIIIAIGYSIGIFFCGVFINWDNVLSGEKVNMANVAYVVMNNFGYQIGRVFGLAENVCVQMGLWVARFVGLSMFLALTGAFFTLSYAPLKQMVMGTPEKIWPKSFLKTKNNISTKAAWAQCAVVAVIIIIVSFGGEAAAQFFKKLVLMTNVAMTLPYLFLAGAFIAFKNKKEIKKPFEVYKTKGMTVLATVLTLLTVGFANLFTIIEPSFSGNWQNTVWMIAGPIIFSVTALLLYSRYEKKNKE
jgi:amino acid transporter